ncbi:hypothetical protein B0H63DRAFT_184316 [Podospora didyma]|uniref:Uncharacterized protein n=1 Tax=Podospora didyma TaxID=330526 RepID=A0AAE0TZT3_9PEZI|nr:hypothetical protein B0H63DRAFT_184316 [Podospora didyma]
MLTVDSFFGSSFLDQLRTIIRMSASRDAPSDELGCETTSNPQNTTTEQSAGTSQPCRSRRQRRVAMITRPEPNSLYDIMHTHAGASLYLLPICWTDQHTRLLGAAFQERPAILTPVPEYIADRWLEPSSMARTLTGELHTLVKKDTSSAGAYCKNRAIKHVLATLFPATLNHPKTGADLDLYFGTKVFKKAVRVPCLWKTPTSFETSFDSAPTVAATSFGKVPSSSCDSTTEYYPNWPMLAYINRSQLAMIRKNLFRVMRGPDNTPNEPVACLQRLRSKMLVPANMEHDSYIVGILLAMAQAHFYKPAKSTAAPSQSSPNARPPLRLPSPVFRDIKVQVITHDDDGNASDPKFVVYTAVVTAAFQSRFLHPHKAPDVSGLDEDIGAGMRITYTSTPFWPLLGLKERLAKALGREIAGDPLYMDPEYIGLWDELLDERILFGTPSFTASFSAARPTTNTTPKKGKKHKRKRRERGPLSEVHNSSFEDDTPTSSDERPTLSPEAKRRRTTRTINPLEVC